ncbi:MAG: response regulator, partial [Bacteroidetes bacterium]
FDREKILSRLGEGEEETSELLVGAAIARKLCAHLEGRFSAEPLRPQGLRVQLSLPVQWVKPTTFAAGEAPATPLHILLVEDHVLNQIATKNLLLNWSPLVKVDLAGNGKIALEKFRSGTYDLILMDLQMPEMDGVTATEHIRRQSDIPIIALTANSSRQEMERCFKAGMNDYLAKPFQPEELYAKILRIMALVAN